MNEVSVKIKFSATHFVMGLISFSTIFSKVRGNNTFLLKKLILLLQIDIIFYKLYKRVGT